MILAKGISQKMWQKTMAVTIALVFVGFGAVAISLFRWQVIRGEELKSAAIDQSLQSTTLTSARGSIYDRTQEKVFAKSASVWTVVLEPAYIKDDEVKQKIASGLAPILGMKEEVITEKLAQKAYFVYLKRRVESEVRDKVNKFLDDNKIRQGVRLIDDYKRYYPYGTVASTVLGFTGSENKGQAGIELQYEKELSGTAGRMVSAKNAIGTDMPFQYEMLMDAENGYDVVLTIDETVQSIMEKYLAKGVEQYAAENGAVAILMDVNTGAILGLAVEGDFNPNEPNIIYNETRRKEIEKLPDAEQNDAYTAELYRQWRNKAVNDVYYPGSVFKMAVGSMGIDEGVIKEDTFFTCTGVATIPGYSKGIKCWNHGGHGTQTFTEGLSNSCNPYIIHVGSLLGPETFYKYFDAFGMTEKTGIDLPGESRSIFYTADKLNPVELATESMGQNFGITPIQMITAASAVANGGYLVQPHVVDRIVDQEGNIISTSDTKYKRQVISNETSKTMSKILKQNVESGTATSGYVQGYQISGKTGTSEKIDRYNEDPTRGMQYIASFCGFAPTDNPQYAMLVFFDEPQGEINGGLTGGNAVAGPVFAEMMEEVLPYLGVRGQYTEEEFDTLDIVAPNVSGIPLEKAVTNLKEENISYTIIGDESDPNIKVSAQIPQAGDTLPKDGHVVLYTEGNEEIGDVEVPDFSGMSIADANFTSNLNGLQIKVVGKAAADTGSVNSQSISPGTTVKEGTVITIRFIDDTITDTLTGGDEHAEP